MTGTTVLLKPRQGYDVQDHTTTHAPPATVGDIPIKSQGRNPDTNSWFGNFMGASPAWNDNSSVVSESSKKRNRGL